MIFAPIKLKGIWSSLLQFCIRILLSVLTQIKTHTSCASVCACVCIHTRVYTLAFLLLFSFSLKFNTTPCGQFRGYLGSLLFTPHTPWKVCFVLRLRLSPHLHRFGMTPCGELQMQTIQMGDEQQLAGQTIYRCVCVLVLHTRTTTTLLFLFFGCFCFDCLLYCSTFAFDFLVPCRSCFAVAVAVVVAVAVIWFSHFSLFSVSHDYTNTLTHVHMYIDIHMYVCVCAEENAIWTAFRGYVRRCPVEEQRGLGVGQVISLLISTFVAFVNV